MTSSFFVSVFSSLLILTHLVGFILIAKGVAILLKGLEGKGQSEVGIMHLRESLIRLLRPALFGLFGLTLLVGLTYWESSALTTWIQVIAPLSTLVWVVWAQKTAKKVQAGKMFEALVPIGAEVGAVGKEQHLDQELIKKADAWAKQNHTFSGKALVRTSLEAINEVSKNEKHKLDLDDLALILRDSFAEIHQVLKRFPLAQSLTLADWIYEVDRLSDIWGDGLSQVELGRHFVNPFTIIDRKMFWQWSTAKPSDLLNDELSAWLHRGVYLIVLRRWQDLSQSKVKDSEGETVSSAERPTSQKPDLLSQQSTPTLWSLMTRKFTVPFWLYYLLSSVAVTLNHGLYGAGFALIVGALLYQSFSQVTSISRWRKELAGLGAIERSKLEALSDKYEQSVKHLEKLGEEFEQEFSQRPSQAILKLMSQGFIDVAHEHRRLEHQNAPLSLSNATLSDVALSVQLVCDDFIKWRNEGSILSMVISFASKLGLNLTNTDEKLLQGIKDWAYAGDQLDLPDHKHESTELSTQEADSHLAVQDESNFSLQAQSERIDAWLKPHIDEAGFLVKMGLSAIQLSLKDRISNELKTRIIPLYQGSVRED